MTLANPFGPPVFGWTRFLKPLILLRPDSKDGEVMSFETIAKYETPELMTILEIERWKAKVSGRENLSSFYLRVTSTFRLEDDDWKLVHRHADSITTFHPDGPLRG